MIKAVSSSTARVNKGKCPHGMPMGACPICNGMKAGGGGARSAAKSKEMSWGECYAAGLAMKSEANRAESLKQFEASSLLAAISRNQLVQNVMQKMLLISAFISDKLVQPVVNFVGKVLNTITKPVKTVFAMVANSFIGRGTKKAFNTVKQGLINISDKIAATIGEPMTAVSHFLSENWRKLKPKRFIFFDQVDTEMHHGESDDELQEIKRLFKLGVFKDKIQSFLKTSKRAY